MIDTRVKYTFSVKALENNAYFNFLEVSVSKARRTATQIIKDNNLSSDNLILYNVDENGKSYKNSIKRNGKWKKQLD